MCLIMSYGRPAQETEPLDVLWSSLALLCWADRWRDPRVSNQQISKEETVSGLALTLCPPLTL